MKGIWSDTARRVGQHQRARLQASATTYPTLFIIAWGLKALLWDVPRLVVRLVAAGVRRLRAGRDRDQAAATVTSIEDAGKRAA